MTTCPDCTQARAGQWCGYRASCAECRARALARSPVAAAAIQSQDAAARTALADAIRRAMPDTDAAEARRMVWAWWKHDHPAQHPTP